MPFLPSPVCQVVFMERVRAHVYVSGRVQGVCFRYETCINANRYGIKGWVRNLGDNRVEAVFEGDKAAVQEVVKWCYSGPQWAWVKDVDLIWEEYQGQFSSFTTR